MSKRSPNRPRSNWAIFKGVGEALSDPGVLSLLFVVVSFVAMGAIVYSFVEGWGVVDSIYFATVTIATVGYGDFSPQTDAGKIFTVIYIVAGIGLFVALASAIADHVIHRARSELGLGDDESED